MQQVKIFINRYFRYLIYFLLLANIVVINKMTEHKELLETSWSPNGILSLELSFSQEKQDSILKTWEVTNRNFIFFGNECKELTLSLNAIRVAGDQNKWDYLFILIYTTSLFVLFIRLYPSKGSASQLSLGLTLIFISGLFDCTENYFISQALLHSNSPAWHIWLASSIKWVSVSLICVYLLIQMIRQKWLVWFLQKVSFYLSLTGKLTWEFRIVFIGLLILFLSLWGMDQGRDLLLIINNYHLGPIFFLGTISILALLNWYLPKLYSIRELQHIRFVNFVSGRWTVDPATRVKDQLDGARLLGSLTFLIPAISILNAMRIFGIPYYLDFINPFFLLVFVLAFYQIALFHGWISHWFAPAGVVNKIRFFALATFTFVFILMLPFFPDSVKPVFLGFLSLNLFLLSFVFIVFSSIRTCDWGISSWKINMTPFVILPGILLLLIFLLANIFPRLFFFNEEWRLLTLPVIICAIAFYTILFTYILIAGRIKNIRYITLLLIAGLVISRIKENPYHKLRTIPSQNGFASADSLPQYIRSWLNKRKAEIDSFHIRTNDSFPVFIVNAYGGGIRAAAWTTLVISDLDRRFADAGIRPFQHFVLAYSGASGGTIGLSQLCAAGYCLQSDPLPGTWEELYKNDYLTPLIIGLMGRDVWNSSVGIHLCPDRSVLQDNVWEKQLSRIGIAYDSPFVKYWDSTALHGKYEVPLLFSNSYDVDSGLKAIVAPVRLSHLQFPGTIFVEDLLLQDRNTSLKLSTGAFLSARFPVISPSGKIDEFHHFMDGGLKENSGAETSREIMEVFAKTLRQLGRSDSVFRKVKVILLSIPNTIAGTDSLQTTANLFELTAPLTALMNNWVGNTRKADTINAKNIDNYFHYQYDQLRPSALCISNFKPVLPLGWQISDYALTQMRSSLDSTKPALDSIVRIVKVGKK